MVAKAAVAMDRRTPTEVADASPAGRRLHDEARADDHVVQAARHRPERLGTSTGSKVPARSRGTFSGTGPTAVTTLTRSPSIDADRGSELSSRRASSRSKDIRGASAAHRPARHKTVHVRFQSTVRMEGGSSTTWLRLSGQA